MAHPWFHSVSSSRNFGGIPDDYLELHSFFDSSKESFGDFRHRSLYHHTAGIFLAERIFGPTLTLSTCSRCGFETDHVIHDPDYRPQMEEGAVHQFEAKVVPTRPVAEQHVIEDLGRLVTVQDWLVEMTPRPWMNRSRRLSAELEREEEV